MTQEFTIPGKWGFKPPDYRVIDYPDRSPLKSQFYFPAFPSKSGTFGLIDFASGKLDRPVHIEENRRREGEEEEFARDRWSRSIVRQGRMARSPLARSVAIYTRIYSRATSLVLPFVITGGHILFIIIG